MKANTDLATQAFAEHAAIILATGDRAAGTAAARRDRIIARMTPEQLRQADALASSLSLVLSRHVEKGHTTR